ncbi:MAG: Putative transmembrane transport protein [uncultured Frankineae bacterium]|uniref:Transmembrane transport protein n=1 Tax=uncultured Frankineae bacterium TaxID=437475 RepID=A0A6J4LEU8_9ACTN|nr:MAG: Putative transmembrane transport protein [uncultured Frankineae bacterium]
MSDAALPLVAVALVVTATVGIGVYGLRLARTTSDFLVASRTVSPLWNASAIGGEYLSAASFLGIAGLVMAYGADALWYPVGFVAGYFVLLLLVAAPLRRSGAYTVPDFAEVRLGSQQLRRLCAGAVVLIGLLYLVPQLHGAGLALRATTGAPVQAGAVLVAVVVTVNVASGGMRSATFVQAFQYWLKLTALAVPAVFLVLAWQADGRAGLAGPTGPVFVASTTVEVDAAVQVVVEQRVRVTVDDRPRTLEPGVRRLEQGSQVVFPAGSAVPHVQGLAPATGRSWALPLSGAGGTEHPLYATYALVLATFLGTMGLPHVLVRFYTNPDGRAARRTTLGVLALLGAFYLLPALYGALGRLYVPELLLTGRTDAVVLALPTAALSGAAGPLLQALLVAGAFAAFLSTSSGLLVTTAGVLAQDLLPPARGAAPGRLRGSVRGFQLAAALAGAISLAVALAAATLPLTQVVGLAFAVAASTFCPLLVLGIWWRGLTAAGATAGLLVGGGLSALAVTSTLTGAVRGGWGEALLAQPAAWTVPTAFAVMVAGSLLTRAQVPADVGRTMLALHAPEALGLPDAPDRSAPGSTARRSQPALWRSRR